ncbi:conserved hypothetical protein [Tenacibaculum ascidiaceicola]
METRALKVKNANKVILLCFFIISSFHCFSQSKLTGAYLRDYSMDDFYEHYEFKANNVFEYHSGGHLGDSEYGKGHYYIKKDSLILNYDLTELKENSFHKEKLYKNSKNIIQVKLNIYDLDEKPLSDITVIGNLKEHYGKTSDKNGEVLLMFDKEKGKREIEVSDVCCGNYSFVLNGEFNYEIKVFLKKRFNNPIAVKNEIKKFKIITLKKEEIKLKTKTGMVVFKKKIH